MSALLEAALADLGPADFGGTMIIYPWDRACERQLIAMLVIVVLIIVFLFWSAAHAVTFCLDAPGQDHAARWAWREVGGRRCFYAMPGGRRVLPRSELAWEAVTPAASSDAEPPVKILSVRVVDSETGAPIDSFEARWSGE